MGAEARLVLYAAGAERARAAAAAAFARMDQLDCILSDYRVDSELHHLCAQAGGSASPVSEDLYGVLALALEVAEASGGAFDPTIGPLTRLWRTARAAGTPPSAEAVAAARGLVGYRHLELDPAPRRARLALAGMQLDLGGIGKGYAADAAGAVLRAQGSRSFLIDFGGELLAGDPPPGRAGWSVQTGGGAVRLARQALSTSGDSQQHLDTADGRLSHVLDARTGAALRDSGDLYVLAERSALADALATAASILSAAEGRRLAEHFSATLLERPKVTHDIASLRSMD